MGERLLAGSPNIRLKSLDFLSALFRHTGGDDTIRHVTKPFFFLAQNCGNAPWLSTNQQNGGKPVATTGDSQMRTFSIILAFAFVLAGSSVAGSTDNSLPGVGTFAYTGSSFAGSVPQAMLVAAR